MRILVCGSRYWHDTERIRQELNRYFSPDNVIIEGGAGGADTIAGMIARELHLHLEVYQAEWQKFGKAAGPLRNKRMLEQGKPDLVLAFYNPKNSKGTVNMILQAHGAGVPVIEFHDSEI